MTKNKDECLYYHRQCPSGCSKVDCHSMFPKENKVIMESQKSVCQSLEHLECPRFISGNEWREEQRLNRVSCQFLGDHYCGRPNLRYCKGAIPPFPIEGDNLKLIEACYGKDHKECPQYKTGIAFQEESRRIKERIVLKGNNND